ncbi:Tyrosine-protein kinase PR2 [Aphelenchoides besseyi]|nr:Tyrosine-protein kinase PR2 [Aphelenchoides besseyi]
MTTKTPPSLFQVLKNAELLEYHDKLRGALKLRNAQDLEDVDEKDLTAIGMSRPEQKRLRREQAKLMPSSFAVRLRRVFGRNGEGVASTSSLPDESEGQHVIPVESVELCRELGRGEFGICFQGTWNLSNGDSIQKVPPEKLKSNPTCFLQEAAVMTRMRHENVIRMYGVVLDVKSVQLVSELAPYGALLDCLKRPVWDEPFSVDKLCDFALQIATGMRYLVDQRLIHRDLAARNVLVANLSKILHAIDTQRKTLDCPLACPEQFYGLMQNCWHHNPDQRLKFDEIVQLIPELMPQLLVTVVENRQVDKLQFSKGEIIILLKKSDEKFWIGAKRNGEIGAFQPDKTVAHLGAENPTGTKKSPIQTMQPPKEKKKEKRKILISEPQGDLRHTCHVGVDGKVFGLIHVGKGDLQPLIGLSDPKSLQRPIAPLRPTRSSNDTHSMKSNRSVEAAQLMANGYDVPQSTARSPLQRPDVPEKPPRNAEAAQPPALPPKPAARIKPQRSLQTEASAPAAAHRTKSLPKSSGSSGIFTGTGSDLDTRDPINTFNNSSQLLDEVLSDLQQDITDFSISTFDFSDTRPLLPPKTSPLTTQQMTDVRPLTHQEGERLERRINIEHKKSGTIASSGFRSISTSRFCRLGN